MTDAAGNVYIAEGDFYIYDAAGKPLHHIPLPDRVLSLVFCGQDRRTPFITTRHAAYVLRMTGTAAPDKGGRN